MLGWMTSLRGKDSGVLTPLGSAPDVTSGCIGRGQWGHRVRSADGNKVGCRFGNETCIHDYKSKNSSSHMMFVRN